MFKKIFFENVIQPCRSVENQANSDLRLLSLNESRELIVVKNLLPPVEKKKK